MKIWTRGTIALAMLGASAASAADQTLPANQIPWAVEAPGQPQRLGRLWGDRSTGAAGTLLKVPGGFRAPVHMHTADYRAVVIEGSWKHWNERGNIGSAVVLRPGSYWSQEGNKWHADACVSKAPCTILLINTRPYRTVLR